MFNTSLGADGAPFPPRSQIQPSDLARAFSLGVNIVSACSMRNGSSAITKFRTVSGDLSGFSMMELFRMEAESHTTTLTSGLVAIEGGLATPAAIEPLMRAAHSLKGAARIVGLDAAVRVAHAMEDCLVAAKKGKLVLEPVHVDILLQGVDLLVQFRRSTSRRLRNGNSNTLARSMRSSRPSVRIQEGKASPPAENRHPWLLPSRRKPGLTFLLPVTRKLRSLRPYLPLNRKRARSRRAPVQLHRSII